MNIPHLNNSRKPLSAMWSSCTATWQTEVLCYTIIVHFSTMLQTDKKAKILLVEDDAVIIEMYRLKFRLSGLNLLVSPSASEAIKTIEKIKPSLILLDLQLENNINGFDILRDMKTRSAIKNIPVYILSNKRERGNREEAIKLGAVDFLAKTDIKPEELIRIIRGRLNNVD